MRFTHSKTEKAAKHLRQLRQIAPGNLWFDFRNWVLFESVRSFVAGCSLALAYPKVGIDGKLPSPMLIFAGNTCFPRLPRKLRATLTVQF
jgi:hypothetical protein